MTDYKRYINATLLASSMFVLAACETGSQLYRWGEYESLIYQMYNEPGNATPAVQIEKLTRDIALAEKEQKPYPPGLWAHLGMMYAAVGNEVQALSAFQQEKELFPESEVLIDGMIKRYRESRGAK